jgi:mRNA interferase RelE/StbE
MYAIHYHETVVSSDIPKLGGREKRLIKSAIEKKLFEHPEIYSVPLRSSLAGYRKLRVGDYRVILKIEKKIIKIFLIAHRSVAYQRMDQRAG